MERNSKKKIDKKRLVATLSLNLIIALAVLAVVITYVGLRYVNFLERNISFDIKDAQKIGNWVFPDNYYAAKSLENIEAGNKNTGAVVIKDKKSGNNILVFMTELSVDQITRTREEVRAAILAKYGFGNFAFIDRSKIGNIGQEIEYSNVVWGTGDSARKGLVGGIDCLKAKNLTDSIFIIVTNDKLKYDMNRALEFVGTLKCLPYSKVDDDKKGVEDKLDTDSDGLTDKVEKMLKTDLYSADTDGDGFTDFDEIRDGHTPMKPRPWDEYTAEEFAKVKADIKYVSIDIYDSLFTKNNF